MEYVEMDSWELLANLERFVTDQKTKLKLEKENIEKSTSPPTRDIVDADRHKFKSSASQTDFSLPNTNEYESMLDHPKYGLPGLGEFNDKRKIIEIEQKRQLNEILNEAIKAKQVEKDNLRKIQSAPIDYDDLLARKRQEEARYRYFSNIGPRYAFSDGAIDERHLLPMRNNYVDERHLVAMRANGIDESVVEELSSLVNRLRMFVTTPEPTNDSIPNSIREVGKPTIGVIPRGNNERRAMFERDNYRLELEEQIREQKERKKRFLAEERDFALAPLPFEAKRPERRRTDLLPVSRPVETEIGNRKLPETWHEGRWPLPEETKNGGNRKLDYQEELRLQIEEKKRREREEKKTERMEEEKLARKLEEDRKKIQDEFEAEQRRQREKETEALNKAKQMTSERERKKTEADRKRKTDSDKEWWEKEEEKPTKEETPRVSVRPPSPIVPTLQIHRKPRRFSPVVSPRPVEVKTNVLGQLSAMRRQLQQEQERIDNKNRFSKVDDYDIIDSPRKHKSFKVLDVEEIASSNRQRHERLKQWQNDDYDSSLSER